MQAADSCSMSIAEMERRKRIIQLKNELAQIAIQWHEYCRGMSEDGGEALTRISLIGRELFELGVRRG